MFTVVTGAAGFIASCLVSKLSSEGIENIVAVDDFSREDKNLNLAAHPDIVKIHRNDFFTWFRKNSHQIASVYHLGARTDTTEFNIAIFDELNLNYSKNVWLLCTEFGVPLIYASSAATYGLGEFGYKDSHEIVEYLQPLNPYGESKNEFDKWVLKQTKTPPFWAGMKFFNVYGPNEYHKARMASVVFHAYNQVKNTGVVKLFRSHRPDFADGMQLRDFVYVKDVVDVLSFMMHSKPENGLYNLGTGTARAFYHLATSVFAALNLEPTIQFIDTPVDIRDKYQYFTEADMGKLRNVAGYEKEFTCLEEGVADYVTNYLASKNYL